MDFSKIILLFRSMYRISYIIVDRNEGYLFICYYCHNYNVLIPGLFTKFVAKFSFLLHVFNLFILEVQPIDTTKLITKNGFKIYLDSIILCIVDFEKNDAHKNHYFEVLVLKLMGNIYFNFCKILLT